MHPRALSGLLPRPLLLLLAAVLLLGATWALLVPPWQSPDEPAHFGYVQTIVEDLALPDDDPGELFSTEQRLAADRSNSVQIAGNLTARAEWSELELRRWRAEDGRLSGSAREDGGGAIAPGAGNPARTNPPLYYAYESVAYLAGSGGHVIDRLYLMRLASVLFLLVAVVATFKLVGELFGNRPLLQLAGGAMVGLQPMATFISASVTPDSLLIALFALVLLLGVRVLRSGLTPPRAVALCALTAAAVLTKGTSYALVPAMLLALAVGAYRLHGGSVRRLAISALLPLAAFVAPVAIWVGSAMIAGRPAVNQVGSGGAGPGVEFPGIVSYAWQYYLPQLPFQTPLPGAFTPIPAFDVWIKGGWAAFGWLEVLFPRPVYMMLAVVTAALVLGGLVALGRSARRRDLAAIAFVALVVLGLLGGLHVTEYRVFSNDGTPINQGRYLLPLLPLLGVAAAGAVSLLGGRARGAAAGALIGGMFALQVFSLGLVAVRFYA